MSRTAATIVTPAVRRSSGPSAGLFALWLVYIVAAEGLDLYSTLKLAAVSGLGWAGGWRVEWNPLLAAIWRADGVGGLVLAKVAFTLAALLLALLVYRLGYRRRATALAAAYVLAYVGLGLWHAWQIAHTVVVVQPLAR